MKLSSKVEVTVRCARQPKDDTYIMYRLGAVPKDLFIHPENITRMVFTVMSRIQSPEVRQLCEFLTQSSGQQRNFKLETVIDFLRSIPTEELAEYYAASSLQTA